MKKSFFTQEFIDFFTELEKNNNKEWFHENKNRYETHVKKPFYALVDACVDRMKSIEPNTDIERRNAVFRINRDIRFSKDKSPYKTHVAAVINDGGKKKMENPGVYFHIDKDKVWVGVGIYGPNKQTLYKLRSYMAEYPEETRLAFDDPEFLNTFGTYQGEKNKVLPKEFKEVAEKIPELYFKSFHYIKEYHGTDYITRDDLVDFIFDHYAKAQPLTTLIRNANEA